MSTHSSTRFMVHADKKLLTSEMSMLGSNPFRQIYPDSCDEGLTVVSIRSGVSADWAVDHTERDAEGAPVWWDLIPTAESIRRVPQIKQWKMRIYND